MLKNKVAVMLAILAAGAIASAPVLASCSKHHSQARCKRHCEKRCAKSKDAKCMDQCMTKAKKS